MKTCKNCNGPLEYVEGNGLSCIDEECPCFCDEWKLIALDGYCSAKPHLDEDPDSNTFGLFVWGDSND